MAGPWEEFKKSDAPEESGPWNDFKKNPSQGRAYKESVKKGDLAKGFKQFGEEMVSPPPFLADLFNSAVGVADSASLENARYLPSFQRALESAESESPTALSVGRGIGNVGLGIGTALIPGGIPAQIAVGAGLGAGQRPEGEQSERLTNAMYGGGLSAILSGAGKGLKSGADSLMQLSVGRNKMTHGVGTDLIREGVGGTRNMMKNQISKKHDDIVDKMINEVSGNTNTYSTSPIAQRVSDVGKKMQVPGGQASSLDQPTLDTISEAATDIGSRGNETLEQMLRRRVAAGNRGYSNVTDEAKRGLVGDISKAEQMAYSELLKQNAPGLIPLDARYSALARGRNALAKDQPLYQGWGVPGLATKAGMGAMGFTAGGIPGAAVGSALSTPLGQSLAAHLLHRGGQSLPALTPAAINALVEEIAREQGAQ